MMPLSPPSVLLEPGDYGIVFGSVRLDAFGGGIMSGNNPTLPGASYARFSPFQGAWVSMDFADTDGPRFTSYGSPVPEPSTLARSIVPRPESVQKTRS